MEMTYEYFLNNINWMVGKHAVFTTRLRSTGETHRGCAKKIWDEKEFAPLKENSLMEIIGVEVI